MRTQAETRRFYAVLALATAALITSGCPSDAGQGQSMNPAPAITSLSPSSANAGAATVAMTVAGTSFAQGSVVRWNGQDRTTTFVSPTQLTATIPASDLVAAGTAQVTVFTPAPGGGTTAALPFMILNLTPGNITTVSPASATAGAAGFTLTVNGANFSSASVVRFNGSDRVTTFVNSTQLLVTILASDLAAGGTHSITVFTPAPGGGVTSAFNFVVNFPVPIVASLSPTSANAGGPAFALTVDGSDFFSASAVNWNGSARVTTFVSNTQLTTMVTAADITAAGTAQVAVFNPAPGGGTSNSQTFTINPAAAPAGVFERVSVASDGSQAAGPSSVTGISADGRYVAFQSRAPNLVPGDTNLVPGFSGSGNDGFIRDTCLGAPAGCMPSTIRVSVDNNGLEINSGSVVGPIVVGPMSTDARFVVFRTAAAVLPADMDGGRVDLYVRDTCIGAANCTPRTILASVDFDNPVLPGDELGLVLDIQAISADGRLVAFSAFSTTRGQFEIFVRDLMAGTTTLVSLPQDELFSNSRSDTPAISADGRFVAFASEATNLVGVNGDTNGIRDLFVRDTLFNTTTRVSVATDGTEQNTVPGGLGISADGRFVAFESSATNLVTGDTNNNDNVFLRDTCAGAPAGCTPSTTRISVSSAGAQGNLGGSLNGGRERSVFSADGRFVVFSSFSTNLVPGDTNNTSDVFVRDTCAGAVGCTPTTVRVSKTTGGVQGNAESSVAVISANGRFVAFNSVASNFVGGASLGVAVFLARTGF